MTLSSCIAIVVAATTVELQQILTTCIIDALDITPMLSGLCGLLTPPTMHCCDFSLLIVKTETESMLGLSKVLTVGHCWPWTQCITELHGVHMLYCTFVVNLGHRCATNTAIQTASQTLHNQRDDSRSRRVR